MGKQKMTNFRNKTNSVLHIIHGWPLAVSSPLFMDNPQRIHKSNPCSGTVNNTINSEAYL